MLHALGRAAEVVDEVFADGLRLTVLEVEGSRISRLEVEFDADGKPKPAGESEAA